MSDTNEPTTKKATKAPKVPKEPKVPKVKKEKKDKYNNFKVPSRTGPSSTRGIHHIYDMIKEAAPTLLQRDDVRNAFNNYVDCLRKYDGTLTSWSPSRGSKYDAGIKIYEKDNNSHLKGLLCRFNYEYDSWKSIDIKNKLRDESNDILNAYKPLYDLIKRDVVPYMEIKQWELKSKKDIEMYHNYIEKLEKDIKTYEDFITKTRKTICDYAQLALDLQNPPKVTSFD
jgi:hypothetical protein